MSKECKCDMRTKTVGDGCEVCNPSLALEYAKTTIADQSEEIERLKKLNVELLTALEGASAKMISAGQCRLLAMPVLLGEAHEIIDTAITIAKEQQ